MSRDQVFVRAGVTVAVAMIVALLLFVGFLFGVAYGMQNYDTLRQEGLQGALR